MVITYPKSTFEPLLFEFIHCWQFIKKIIHAFRLREIGILFEMLLNSFPQLFWLKIRKTTERFKPCWYKWWSPENNLWLNDLQKNILDQIINSKIINILWQMAKYTFQPKFIYITLMMTSSNWEGIWRNHEIVLLDNNLRVRSLEVTLTENFFLHFCNAYVFNYNQTLRKSWMATAYFIIWIKHLSV